MTSLHCIQFYLDKTLTKKFLAFPQSCNGCKAPFKIVNDITAYILDEDVFRTLFEDLILKFYLYVGHTV